MPHEASELLDHHNIHFAFEAIHQNATNLPLLQTALAKAQDLISTNPSKNLHDIISRLQSTIKQTTKLQNK